MPFDASTPWGKAFAKMMRSDKVETFTVLNLYRKSNDYDEKLCQTFREMYGYNITITQPQVHDNSMPVPKVCIDFESDADITMFMLRYHLQ